MSDPSKSEEKKTEEKLDKVLELNFKNDLPWFADRIIFLAKGGSHSYGTSVPESDEDFRGVVIPTLPYFFGCGEFKFEQVTSTTPDLTFHDIRKFIRLAAGGKPQMLEIMNVVPEDVLICNPLMGKILEHRDWFLSQRIVKPFITGPRSVLQSMQVQIRQLDDSSTAEDIENAVPSGKDIMHMIRLMRMGLEIITGKGVITRRPDAEELLNIRAGLWSLEQAVEASKELEQKAAEALKKTKLPLTPDMVKVDSLCTAVVQASFEHEIKVPIMAVGFKGMDMSFSIGNLTPKKLSPSSEEA